MPNFKLISKRKSKLRPNHFYYTFSYSDENNLIHFVTIVAENNEEAIELLNTDMQDLEPSAAIHNIISNFFNSDVARVLINPFISNTAKIYCSFQGTCEWFEIPVNIIEKLTQVGYSQCNSFEYPLAEITFKEAYSYEKGLIKGKWWSKFINDYEGDFIQTDTTFLSKSAEDLAKELSGSQWVARYPGSSSVDDLVSPFRENVQDFIQAIKNGSGAVKISATYRPTERAYLMQTSWDIAKGNIKAKDAPVLAGVDIEWVHPTDTESIKAAQDMVSGYGIVFRPAYPTKHSDKTAIDMNISWTGVLKIAQKDGTIVEIKSTPRDNDNTELQDVGETYSVKKLKSDKPHWSDDGH